MQTIMIDGSRYSTPRELHLALKQMLSLPSFYGMNADALNDCLSERTQPVNLWILASAVSVISEVFRDNGGIVKEL